LLDDVYKSWRNKAHFRNHFLQSNKSKSAKNRPNPDFCEAIQRMSILYGLSFFAERFSVASENAEFGRLLRGNKYYQFIGGLNEWLWNHCGEAYNPLFQFGYDIVVNDLILKMAGRFSFHQDLQPKFIDEAGIDSHVTHLLKPLRLRIEHLESRILVLETYKMDFATEWAMSVNKNANSPVGRVGKIESQVERVESEKSKFLNLQLITKCELDVVESSILISLHAKGHSKSTRKNKNAKSSEGRVGNAAEVRDTEHLDSSNTELVNPTFGDEDKAILPSAKNTKKIFEVESDSGVAPKKSKQQIDVATDFHYFSSDDVEQNVEEEDEDEDEKNNDDDGKKSDGEEDDYCEYKFGQEPKKRMYRD
jgi:hypothetical protein